MLASKLKPNKIVEYLYDKLKERLPEDIYVLGWYIRLQGDDDDVLVPDAHFAIVLETPTKGIGLKHFITVPQTDDGISLAAAALMLVLG